MNHDEKWSYASNDYVSFDRQRSRKRCRSPSIEEYNFPNRRPTLIEENCESKGSIDFNYVKYNPLNEHDCFPQKDCYSNRNIKGSTSQQRLGYRSHQRSANHYERRTIVSDDGERWRSTSTYQTRDTKEDVSSFRFMKTDGGGDGWCRPAGSRASNAQNVDDDYDTSCSQIRPKPLGKISRLNSRFNKEIDYWKDDGRGVQGRQKEQVCHPYFYESPATSDHDDMNRAPKWEDECVDYYKGAEVNKFKSYSRKSRIDLENDHKGCTSFSRKQDRSNDESNWKQKHLDNSRRSPGYNSLKDPSSPRRWFRNDSRRMCYNENRTGHSRYSTWDVKLDNSDDPGLLASYTSLDVPLTSSVLESNTIGSIQSAPVVVTSPNHSYHTDTALVGDTAAQTSGNCEVVPPPTIVSVHLQGIPLPSLRSVSQSYCRSSKIGVECDTSNGRDIESHIKDDNKAFSVDNSTKAMLIEETFPVIDQKHQVCGLMEEQETNKATGPTVTEEMLHHSVPKKRKVQIEKPRQNRIESSVIEKQSCKPEIKVTKAELQEKVEKRVPNNIADIYAKHTYVDKRYVSQTKTTSDNCDLVDSSDDEKISRKAKRAECRIRKFQGGALAGAQKQIPNPIGDIITKEICVDTRYISKTKATSDNVDLVDSSDDENDERLAKKSERRIRKIQRGVSHLEKSENKVRKLSKVEKKSSLSVAEYYSKAINRPTTKIQDCKDPSLVTIGCRVAIYWDGEGTYFKGTVTKERPNKERRFRVLYDDGDKDWINFNNERFRILKMPLPLSPKGTSTTKIVDNKMQHRGKSDIAKHVPTPRSNVLDKQNIAERSAIEFSQPPPTKLPLENRKKKQSGDLMPHCVNEPSKLKVRKIPDHNAPETKDYQDDLKSVRQSCEVGVESFSQVSYSSNAIANFKQHQATNTTIVESDWVRASIRRDSSDSETDEDEVLQWGFRMFGVARAKSIQTDSRPIANYVHCDSKKTEAAEQENEEKRKKEEARPLTAKEIRVILGDDNDVANAEHWVRRSSRQPCKSILNSPKLKSLLEKLRCNDYDMIVLKMKKYCNDPATPQVVIDSVLDALEDNTNCEALYIQNFNIGMQDKQVMHLLKILQRPSCKIWCLNIGETYQVQTETWEAFAEGLKDTKITHMYASEHMISGELKEEIRTIIRNNRSKHKMHCDPNNLDTIVQCTHCWWNPINAVVLRPYLKRKGYERILFDAEAQGLPGTMSEAKYLH